MFKKYFLMVCIFLVVFLLFLNSVNAICCGDDCYPDADICCDGIGYDGCKNSAGQPFCPNDVLPDCLVCQCSDRLNCNWYEDNTLCVGEDNVCRAVPNIDLPEYGECIVIPCTLNSAYWSTTLAYEGDPVQLNLETSACNGRQATFTIWESDLLGDDLVGNQPPSATIVSDKATTTWTAEYGSDWWGSDSEYYFIVIVEDKSINSENYLTIEKAEEQCGNGRIDIGETCDGTNFGPVTDCTYLGFVSGTLKCFEPGTEHECHFDTNACTDGEGICGDSIINIGEECDGPKPWGSIQGCRDLNDFTGGELVCDYDSCFFDTYSCSKETSYCGDNIINLGEECDGTNWGTIKDCKSLGFTGGNLACSGCFFDTGACTDSLGVCGDGKINIGETCDTNNLNNKDCTDFGFEKGDLECYSKGDKHECHFDTWDCSRKKTFCGNDLKEGKEECDGFDDLACPYQCQEDCTCPKCGIYWDCSQTRWSECNPETKLRKRIGECTKTEFIPPECQAYEPPNEKACIPEKEFPFFTNFNIILTVLILTAYYFYKKIKPKK